MMISFLIVIVTTNAFATLQNIPEILSLYRTSAELSTNISNLILRHYPFVKKQFCPYDTRIEMVQLGNSKANMTAIITCNMHARQLITAEICLDFVYEMLSRKKELLRMYSFKIVYLTNRERDRMFSGDYCVRDNEHGVDLNRNFPTGWDKGGDGRPQDNPGPYPLSQKYSKCLDYLAKKYKPTAYVDLHSGQFSLLYYQNISQHQNNSKQNNQLQILTNIQKKYCKPCRILNLYTFSNILGEGIVYLKQQYKVKYSSIFQVFGGYNANIAMPTRCLVIFNPLTKPELDYYRNKWTMALVEYFLEIYRKQSK